MDMKVFIILILCGVAIFGVVKVLGSTLSPAEYSGDQTNVKGDVGVGAVSKALMPAMVWAEPRPTTTRTDRERMRVGEIRVGETFVVLKHVRRGGPLWINIRSQDRDLEGWIVSKPDDPFMAERLNGR
jgi:hypothetical protein